MPNTSDTEFYSLSLNSLSPPPLPSYEDATKHSRNGSLDEKQAAFSPRAFVRQLTPPFFRTSTSEVETGETESSRLGAWINRLTDLVINWWLWELFCWVTSAFCVFAIALILGYYDGRPIPNRWPLGITLNAYISVLSGIGKYMLSVPVDEALGQLKWQFFSKGPPKPLIEFERYDDATRGPWGALALLVSNRGRSIASLAASVTLLSLALDPFFQQLVTTPQRPSQFGKSSVPRMVNFTSQRNAYGISDDLGDFIAPDLWLDSTVFQFLVNNATDTGINAYCPTEECTWPPFDTLAVCSQCQDVSPMLTWACLEESGDWKTDYIINGTNNTREISCGYFLNATTDEPLLMTGYADSGPGAGNGSKEALSMRIFNLEDVNVDIAYWGGSINYKTAAFPIVDFIQATVPNATSVFQNATPSVQECVLQWCTNRIAGFYQDGVYSEHILSVNYGESDLPNGLEMETQPWDNSILNFFYNKNVTITPADQNLTFFVPNRTALQTIFLLQEYVPSFVTTANESATPLLHAFNFVNFDTRYYNYTNNPFTGRSDVGKYWADMAGAMTNVIRNYPIGSDNFLGSGGVETYIHVRWGFFALPLVLMIATLVVLIVTIAKHDRNGSAGIWKTSSIAALASGLNDNSREAFQPKQGLLGMFETATTLHVALQSHGGRSQLRVFPAE